MPVPGLPFTDGQLFQLTNAVLPAWVGLLLFPRLGVPLATAVSCAMSALYIATLIGTFSAPELAENPLALMTSFEGVAKLLGTRAAVLPAWVHYAAFDVWVGRWEVLDARSLGIPQWLMALPLLLTMFLGPSGLLLYLALIRPFFRPRAAAAGTKQD
ncbi:hypothetical protein ABPG77_006906 [Micractinium sp. CCAP 211/92]